MDRWVKMYVHQERAGPTSKDFQNFLNDDDDVDVVVVEWDADFDDDVLPDPETPRQPLLAALPSTEATLEFLGEWLWPA